MSTPQIQGHPTAQEATDCFEREFNAHGTAYLFEQRMNSAATKLRRLSYATFVIPVVLAGLLTTWDNATFGTYVKIASAVASVCVALFGLWAAVKNWSNDLSDSARSMVASDQLEKQWKYAQTLHDTEFVAEFAKLRALDAQQESHDKALGFTDADKRRGYRKALYHFRKTCPTCNKMPTGLKANGSVCQTCGDF